MMRTMMGRLLAVSGLLAVVLWGSLLWAQQGAEGSVEQVFDLSALQGEGEGAAKAYQSGEYAEAARLYQVLVDTRGATADRLYNLGTSWALADKPGRALWALERARVLRPGDEAIGHNLEVMRQRVRVGRLRNARAARLTEGEPDGLFWFRLGTSWSTSLFLIVVLLCNALGWGLLALRRRGEEGGRKDALTVAATLCLVVAFLGTSALVMRAVAVSQVKVGITLEAEAQLAVSPVVTSQKARHPDLFEGAVVRVLERRSDGWVHVGLVDGTQGWVTDQEVGLVLP